MRILPRTSWLRARLLTRELACSAIWIVVLLGLEWLGRARSTSDAQDSLGVVVLLTFLVLTILEHARRPLSFMTALGQLFDRIGERVKENGLEAGVDLREVPPLERAFPRRIAVVLGVSFATLLASWFLRAGLPSGLRERVFGLSAALWFVVLGLIWSVLIFGSLILVARPLRVLLDGLQNSTWWRRKPELVTVSSVRTVFLFAFCALGATLPDWVPLVLVGVSLVVLTLAVTFPGSPRLLVLWRPAREDARAMRVADWTRMLLSPIVCLTCLGLAVVFVARGEQLGPDPVATKMPLTAFLGLVFAWAMAAASVESVGIRGVSLVLARLRDPARDIRPRVFVRGALDRATRTSVSLRLAARGLTARFGGGRRKTDVALQIDPGVEAPWHFTDPWPVAIAPESLDDPELLRVIERREEILCRRHLLHGLARLFKAVAGREFEHGSGTWVCPHHWSFSGLQRDVDELDRWSIGPSFHKTIPMRARVHFHRVLRSLEVDLIFVEDGVPFRRLKRVFAMMFEIYDIFGGQRRAEDLHFSGLPGVRVIVHDHDLEEPFESNRYPEPAYIDMGRARMLHVFKDRGADDEDVIVPHVSDFVPDFAPVLI